MKKNYLLLIFFVCSSFLWAQEKTVTGTVTDEQGIPLAGANILVQNTTNGTQADFDGKYSIQVAEGQVLVVSYVGYTTQSITVGTASVIDVSLQEDAAQLDEVVVVGYGTQKKSTLTGSVSTIKSADLVKQPVFQTSQALVGLAPGLNAIQSSSQPGDDGADLLIRGVGSLNPDTANGPLVLIDGVAGNINGVAPGDVESISVLKDASASAIYGSRASNGVILVTTKRGKSGKLNINLNTNLSIQTLTNKPKFAGAIRYLEAVVEATGNSVDQQLLDDYRANLGSDPDVYPDTDWVDEVFSEQGLQQNIELSMNGGSERIRTAASLIYQNQEGNIPNYDFKSYNGRFNNDFKVTDKLNIGIDLNFRKSITNSSSRGLGNTAGQAFRIPPIYSVVNTDGTWGPGWNGQNPVAAARVGGLSTTTSDYFRLILKADYNVLPGLNLSVMYSPEDSKSANKNFNPQYDWIDYRSGAENSSPQTTDDVRLIHSNNSSFTDNFNALITYDKSFNEKHNFSLLGGYEFIKFKNQFLRVQRNGYLFQNLQQIVAGDPDLDETDGSASQNGLVSYFGRFKYNFNEKYLFEASVRRDGSSRFSEENRWGTFPSLSAAWVLTKESFIQPSDFLSYLKFNASWGQLGNQSIGSDFPYQALISFGGTGFIFGDQPVQGAAQFTLANQNITWETGTKKDVGVSARLFNNRLTLEGGYYIRETRDILYRIDIPLSVGQDAPFQNVSAVDNTGWELDASWRDNIGKDFTYGIRLNIANNKNEIVGFADGIEQDGNLRVGDALGTIFGLQVEGIYQTQEEIDAHGVTGAGSPQPGDLRYADVASFVTEIDENGNERQVRVMEPDGVIGAADIVKLGNSIPNLNYNLNLDFKYKNLDLSIFLNGVGERETYINGDVGWSFFNAGKIQEWQLDAWSPTNTDASLPRLITGSSNRNWRSNSTWVRDASYLRVRNITLGYTLPKMVSNKLGIGSLRIYGSGQNLFTFSSLPDGIDPLNPSGNSGTLYPITSTYTLGINLNF